MDKKTTINENDLSSLKLTQMSSSNAGCCFNYCPHLVATIQLLLICALKLPFCYDFIIYFNHLKDYGIMLCIIVEILHTIVLLFIWLLLTLKISKLKCVQKLIFKSGTRNASYFLFLYPVKKNPKPDRVKSGLKYRFKIRTFQFYF